MRWIQFGQGIWMQICMLASVTDADTIIFGMNQNPDAIQEI